MTEEVKLFIVEGEKRDQRLINNLLRCFLTGKYKVKVVTIVAAQNIYMLYEKLNEDGFDTDIVELLREQSQEASEQLEGIKRQSISEIYMFFDYDIQQDNLPNKGDRNLPEDAIAQMLRIFDNETENGKMYISYPMVEAAYDYREGLCEAYTGCSIQTEDIHKYKKMTGKNVSKSGRHFTISDWKEIINTFVLRAKCLLDMDSVTFSEYRRMVSTDSIFSKQKQLKRSSQKVFIISALPEFLLDYFKEDFFKSNVKRAHYNFYNCERNR